MELEEKISALIKQQAGARVFSLTHDGHRIWVKLAAPGEKNLWHTLLLLLHKVTGNPFLIPTVVIDPQRSLADEAATLARLRAAGVRVPEVLLQRENFLALSDAGTPIEALLEESTLAPAAKLAIAYQASDSLAALHNAGRYHSRPALKDMTCLNQQVYFVDFEENLQGVLSTDQAIVRDACIYIHALFKTVGDHRLRDEALTRYLTRIDPAIRRRVGQEVKKYRIIRLLLKPLYPLLGEDGRALYDMLDFLLVRAPTRS